MARVISLHEYDLKPGADEPAFERAIHEAERRGLFALPGLIEYHFLKGIKGARKGRYTAVWVFESREAWESLWGSLEAPRRVRDIRKRGGCGRTRFWRRS